MQHQVHSAVPTLYMAMTSSSLWSQNISEGLDCDKMCGLALFLYNAMCIWTDNQDWSTTLTEVEVVAVF